MSDFLPTLGVLFVLTLVLLRALRGYSHPERVLLWGSFIAHQIASFGNILLYKYHYGYGDMLSYHFYGVVIADGMRADFWGFLPHLLGLTFHSMDPLPVPIEPLGTSSGTMQALSGILSYLLFDSLYASCSLIAGLSFFSKLALCEITLHELPNLPRRVSISACTLVPSAIIWSCALLKEPFAMIGFFFALRAAHRIMIYGPSRGALATLVAGVTGLLLVKGYVAPIAACAFGAWYFASRVEKTREDIVARVFRIVGVATGVVAALALLGSVFPLLALSGVQEKIATQQAASASIDANSNFTLGSGSGSASAQVALAPLALFTALFRPTLLESKNLLTAANALENTFFALVAVWIPFRRGIGSVLSEFAQRSYLVFCLVFVGLFATLTGLGSTNLGALSRYRAPLVPFFVTMLLALLAKPTRIVTVSRAPLPSPVRNTSSQLGLR